MVASRRGNQPLLRKGGRGAHGLRPIDAGVEHTLFELHSHMRDVDGLHAPEAIDELCKLLFLKVFDERTAKSGGAFVLQQAAHASARELVAAARKLFVRALAAEQARLGPTGKVLAAFSPELCLSDRALARCLDQLAVFSIGATALDLKGRAFQSVLAPAARAGMGQYFTPEAVGEMMVRVLAPRRGERVIDPFAGSAHFLTLCARSRRASAGKRGGESLRAYCAQSLFGIEKSDRMMRIAWTDLMLHELSGLQLLCADALGPPSRLSAHALGSFDVVITNPPFGSVLRSDAVAELGGYETATARGTTLVEVLALERAIHFLRPGGRLGIVLPDGLLGNPRAVATRHWAARQLSLRAIVSLPPETFAPFGANVKTSVVFGRRRAPGRVQDERKEERKDVLLARVDAVGHDSSGRAVSTGDLPAVTEALQHFFAQEGW